MIGSALKKYFSLFTFDAMPIRYPSECFYKHDLCLKIVITFNIEIIMFCSTD